MTNPSLLALIQNGALLLAMAVVFDLFVLRDRAYQSPIHQAGVGLLVGAIGVIVMLTSWVLMPGVIFDTRSVLLSISGLFFGAIPTIIAMLVMAAFRIYQGGNGMLPGVLVIFATGTIGILWRSARRQSSASIRWKELYLFGLVSHLVMITLMLAMPRQIILQVLSAISLPVLLIFPVITVLLGMLMVNREQRDDIQEDLAQTTARLNITQQITKVGGWEMDIIKDTMFWTDEAYRIHGLSVEDIPPGTSEHIQFSLLCYDPAYKPMILKAFQDCCERGIPYEFESPFTTFKGEHIWIHTEAQAVLEKGKIVRVVGNIMDITERHKAEQALYFTQFVVDHLSDAIYWANSSGQLIYVNNSACKMLGFPQDELLSMRVMDITPNYIQETWDAHWEKLKEIWAQTFESELLTKTGQSIPVEITTSYLEFRGQASLCGVARDIRERKKAEEKLKESEEFNRRIVQTANEGIWAMDQGITTTFVNPKMAEMLGYRVDEMLGQPVTSLMIPEDLTDHDQKMTQRKSGQKGFYERRFIRKDGTVLWTLVSSTPIMSPEAEFCGSFGMFTDITERKRSEEALQKSQSALIEAQSIAKIGSWEYDVFQDRLTWTIEMFRIFDVDPALGEPDWQDHRLKIHPQDWERIDQAFQEAIQSGNPYREEFRIVHRDGIVIWAETVGNPRRDKAGSVIQLIGTVQDITERKNTETALQRERDLAESVIETAQTIVLLLDTRGRIVLFNPYMEDVSGYRLAEVQGQDWIDTFLPKHNQENIRNLFLKAINSTQTRGNISPIVTKDGQERQIEWYDKTLRDENGIVIGLLSNGQDITERKKDEEQIKASLAEKEVLLREIHHRVKNNLEVVLSLAEMQTRRMTDPLTTQAMLQLQERIHTIALVHESIYRSPDLTHINAQQYLQKLINHLYLAFDFANISVHVDAAQINFDIETAIPCGLIVTELVTNAVKYAFPRPSPDSAHLAPSEPNQIRINMYSEGLQWILQVSDNGIGLPADSGCPKSHALGLRLVRGLVGQLHGTLEIVSPPGSLFRIVFTLAKEPV